MPNSVFDSIKSNISAFLGKASVHDLSLTEIDLPKEDKCIRQQLIIENRSYFFCASRESLPFTKCEEQFCRELLTAFSALFAGFRLEGYAAHLRTALLASIMDITVARFLRGDRSKGFWPIQQLVQLLKNLSYQRYEGKPATSGFIVYRTTQPILKKLLKELSHSSIQVTPPEPVTAGFFENPLTYKFVDGNNLFFLANIQMQVTGLLKKNGSKSLSDVELLTQRDLFSIVRGAGAGAFAVTVNSSSELEFMINPEKLLVRRKGQWVIFDHEIFRSFLKGCLDFSAIDDLLWTVYALSKTRTGTVILIHSGTPRQLSKLKKGSVGGDDHIGRLLVGRVKGRTVSELKDSGAMMKILSADGMTVFNKSGKLAETGFIIDTSHVKEIVIGGGRTTAASAASHFGKVIKVSQDGPIELYDKGKIIYTFG